MNKGQQNIAARIIDLYVKDKVPAPIRDSFFVWLASDVHKEAKDKALVDIWNSIDKDSTRATRKSFAKLKATIYPESARKRVLIPKIWLKVAAVAVPIMVMIGALYMLVYKPGIDAGRLSERMALVTTVGINEELVLPDGTEVWVKGGSRITYSENGRRERVVDLAGEAYFKVVHDKESPFRVQTKHLLVTVFGTGFDVDAPDDSQLASVTLDEGSIQAEAGGKRILMKPGEQLTYDATTDSIELKSGVWDSFKWKSAKLSFDHATLPEILFALERFYHVTIEADGPMMTDERYSTRFTGDENLEDVLAVLKSLTGLTYRIEGNRVETTMN